MHTKIENLINIVIKNGEISEKAKSLILRKAEALGVDKDEVTRMIDKKLNEIKADQNNTVSIGVDKKPEMMSDVKLQQMETGQQKQSKEKVDNTKYCTACGTPAKALDAVCSKCGYKFSVNDSKATGQPTLLVKMATVSTYCTACGTPAKALDAVCSKCGGQLATYPQAPPLLKMFIVLFFLFFLLLFYLIVV